MSIGWAASLSEGGSDLSEPPKDELDASDPIKADLHCLGAISGIPRHDCTLLRQDLHDTRTTEENSMKRVFALSLTAIATTAAMSVPLTAQAAAPTAPPGRYFASCDALTRAWPNGVARGPVAANAAVRDGYSRPATSARAKAVYLRNASRLDRDGDGTACEN